MLGKKKTKKEEERKDTKKEHTYQNQPADKPRWGETEKSENGDANWDVFTIGTREGNVGEYSTRNSARTHVDDEGDLVERFGVERSDGTIRRLEMRGEKLEKLLEQIMKEIQGARLTKYSNGSTFTTSSS